MSDLSLPRAATSAAAVALVALWTAIGHGQLSPASRQRWMIQETGLPAIDRGLRDQDPPRAARTAQRSRSHPHQQRRHAALRSRIDHRQVQGRRDAQRHWRGDRAGRGRRSPTDRRGPTSTSWRFPPTPIRKPPRPRCARGRMSNTRSRATATTRWRARTTRCTPTSGTSPPSTWSARGTSSPAPRRASSSPCSTAAWRSGRARCATTRASRFA